MDSSLGIAWKNDVLLFGKLYAPDHAMFCLCSLHQFIDEGAGDRDSILDEVGSDHVGWQLARLQAAITQTLQI